LSGLACWGATASRANHFIVTGAAAARSAALQGVRCASSAAAASRWPTVRTAPARLRAACPHGSRQYATVCSLLFHACSCTCAAHILPCVVALVLPPPASLLLTVTGCGSQAQAPSMSLPPHARHAVGWWLLGSAAAVFIMIGIGGVTRLTRSGLSMTEWKFTGERWPSSQARRPCSAPARAPPCYAECVQADKQREFAVLQSFYAATYLRQCRTSARCGVRRTGTWNLRSTGHRQSTSA